MPSGLGVDALRPDLLDVTGGDQAHQGARDFTVVRVRRATELRARVPIVIARDAFPKAKLERIQISFRVVCHVAFVRIDSGWGYPPISAVFVRNFGPRSPSRSLTLTLVRPTLPGDPHAGLCLALRSDNLQDPARMEIWREFHFEAAHLLPNVPDGQKCKRKHFWWYHGSWQCALRCAAA